MSSRHPRLAATATTNNANQKSGPAVASNIRAARLACRSAVMSIESGTSRGAVKLGNSASLVRQDFGVTQQMYWLPCQTSTVAPFVSRERRAQSSAVCKSGNRRSEFGADKVQPLSSQRSKTRLGTACERSRSIFGGNEQHCGQPPRRPALGFMDAGGIAAALEQGETHGISAGEEGAARKAVAIACDPMAVAVMPNVEVMR